MDESIASKRVVLGAVCRELDDVTHDCFHPRVWSELDGILLLDMTVMTVVALEVGSVTEFCSR